MTDFKTINDFDWAGKTALLRTDYNVPLNDGIILDDTRLQTSIETITALRGKGAKIVIMCHMGRPNGQKNDAHSLRPVQQWLENHLEQSVTLVDDLTKTTIDTDIALLENLRFWPGETKNGPDFSEKLSHFGDIYVNDAFSNSHRAHASMVGITKYLPSCAGLLLEKELKALSTALETPKNPVMAIIGGAKISTKTDLIFNLLPKMDMIVLGGAMANTFALAKGHDMGASLIEETMIETAKKIIDVAVQNNCELFVPHDFIASKEFKENAPHSHKNDVDFDANDIAIDLGTDAVKTIKAMIDRANTLLWNGPLGAFELKPFDSATNNVAKHVVQRTKNNALISIGGGGDTVSALKNADSADGFSYVSNAGGAFLEWLEGKPLPAIKALKNDKN